MFLALCYRKLDVFITISSVSLLFIVAPPPTHVKRRRGVGKEGFAKVKDIKKLFLGFLYIQRLPYALAI